MICWYLKIPCETCIGEYKKTGKGHAWNRVKVNGKWECLDVTFDSDVTYQEFGNASKKKRIAEIRKYYYPYKINNGCINDYFLLSKKKMNKDHEYEYFNEAALYMS